MKKDKYGVFEIFINRDETKNEHIIKHGQKIKLHLKNAHDAYCDRNLAYIKYTLQNESTNIFDGVFWNPEEPYEFQFPAPVTPINLKIYEAHVGMASTEQRVATYDEFRLNILPRIKRAGYNCIQLMAVQEHAYYGSFGYHVTNYFATSSRSGDPDSLKRLIDEAHQMGFIMLMDLVHSHASTNAIDGIGDMDGSGFQYFHAGERGEHKQWDSKVFNYGKYEVQRFLISNIRYWLKEFKFDGFRFDGITSMLY